MNSMPVLKLAPLLCPGDVLPFRAPVDDIALEPPATAVQLVEIEHGNLVIIGRGHLTDLACQVILENARDWRRLDRLTRRFADSLPEPSVAMRSVRRAR